MFEGILIKSFFIVGRAVLSAVCFASKFAKSAEKITLFIKNSN
jgi:hypothetical protein